jgi:phenylacetate-coenzyme A ligase PaaK-like adenylate-forming protein
MSSYEELRQRHLAEMMARIPEHLERITWPVERLRAEREEKLRALVRVAKEHSPWHRERLADLEPDTLHEAELERIPVMTRDDLMSHWDDIVTDRRLSLAMVEDHLESLKTDAYLLDHFHGLASGGSSGRRGVFVYDWEAWLVSYLAFIRHGLRASMNDPELSGQPLVVGSVAAEKPTHMTSVMTQTFASPMITSHSFPVTLPLDEIVAGLNAARPNVLIGYTSALALLAHEARAGRLRIAPRHLIPSSEPLLPEVRALLEETWSASVGNMWGTTEGGPTGDSCGQGPGMHLSDDLLIIEPVDARGRPVPPGVRSAKLYLTNLYNLTLPLLRMEVTDEITLLDEPCPCGSTHQSVADIQGRLDDSFVYAEGVAIHPIVFRSPLGRQRNIIEYQVRQTQRGATIAICCAGDVDLTGLREEITQGLTQLGLPDPTVDIKRVGQLQRQASGKLKRMIPLA